MKSLWERRVPPFSCHFLYPNESSSWPVLKELNDLWIPIWSGCTAISYVKGLLLSRVTLYLPATILDITGEVCNNLGRYILGPWIIRDLMRTTCAQRLWVAFDCNKGATSENCLSFSLFPKYFQVTFSIDFLITL